MNDAFFEAEKIKEALDVLKYNEQLFEIRILKSKQTFSGYFTDTDTLLSALDDMIYNHGLQGANIFYTLNVIDPDCYSREQHDKFMQSKTTTSDADILSYQWLLIDLDPKRKTGISSTDEEVSEALKRGEHIARYLRERNFPAPIMALSGNGIHLLYSVNLANTQDNARLIERCLKALALLFSDDVVEVDTSVFNPSRISKLYGTTAQKGASTKNRPHRMSKIISVPPIREVVRKELLESLAAEYPQEVSVPKTTNKSTFNLEGWLDEYGIRVHAVKEWKDATRYVLEECPFDSNHKAPDATIIKMQSGAICFKCLHNSCSGHDWREFRLRFEPDAYDDKRAEEEAHCEEGWKQYKAYNRQRTDITYQEEKIDPEHIERAFLTLDDIANMPVEERVVIKTGLDEFDRKTGGLAKKEISLVSGLRGSAKSTWLSQVGLNAIDQGYRTIFYSGELTAMRFSNWLYQQAAGRDWVVKSDKYENFWYCKEEAKPQIRAWIQDKLYIYNNKCGSNFKLIAKHLQEIIKRLQADLVIIDNMSILDLSDITDDRRADKWDQQKLFVETLKNLAETCNCHIVFVAHPRKAAGFLRLDDVGGSGSLGNLVDNAFIVHRVNRDFRRGYKRDIQGIIDPKGKSFVDDENEARAELGDNCIEMVKERETGIQDLFIPLWYEQETRRLKNTEYELVIYKWDYDGFLGRQQNDPSPFEEG